MEWIEFTCEQHIAIITLNRASALNALTFEMICALRTQLKRWDDDPAIHAIVIKAVEGRAFCAGGDVRFIYNLGVNNAHDAGAHADIMHFFACEYSLNHLISTLTKPYIALMNGLTMGGGVGISLHGSHRVATEHFRFAMPETTIGFFPDIGSSYLLSRCPGAFGLYLGLTGRQINAVQAKALQLVQHVIPSEQLNLLLKDLIACDLSINAHERVSALLQRFEKPTQFESMHVLQTCVDVHFDKPTVEAIMRSLVDAQSEWSQQTYQLLLEKAPLSLKVTFEQLQRAQSQTLDVCLQMDYGLTSHFMQQTDFYEGVRAKLVDKDNKPHWKPDTLAQVTPSMVAKYFEPCVMSIFEMC